MNKEVQKSMWNDAARGGGVIGLVLFAVALVDGLFQLNGAQGIVSMANFVILGFFIYRFAHSRSLKYGADGFTFGQSMGFILAMMLFAGFIVGLGNFLLYNYITPDYFNEIYNNALDNNPLVDPDSPLGRQSIQMAKAMMRNPIFQLFSGMLSMLLYGGLIGLIVSAFVKRRPDVFADSDNKL